MDFMSLMQGLGGKGVGDNADSLLPLLGQISPQMFGKGTVGGGIMSLLPLAQQFGQKKQLPAIDFLQARQDIGFGTPRGGLLDPSLFNQIGRY